MLRPVQITLRSSAPVAAPAWDWRMNRCDAVLWCDGSNLQSTAVRSGGPVLGEWDDPLAALRWMQRFDVSRVRAEPGEDVRWVGYLSYDLARRFEVLPPAARDELNLPLFAFALGAGDRASDEPAAPGPGSRGARHVHSNFTREQFEASVARAIEYVRAGDVFQVNLSQRLRAAPAPSANAVFDRLQHNGGAHYAAQLDFGDFALVSESPELFLHLSPDRHVTTRPVKGTRPRAPGMDVALRDSAKDQAELAMIVDLERNDLGRVCEIGSVKVVEPRAIEAHRTVYHGVATIEGMLRHDVGFVDLLRATFPSGSVTGAPKIRAMQIIDELEPVRRGPYCGAIGYLAADGTIEFNVAIRTMILKDGFAHIPVGGGIVADSDPAAEYEETLVKAQAMLAALGVTPATGVR